MIPAPLSSAIVEIVTTEGTSLGTGFLVTCDGAVLTAAHVVGNDEIVIVRFGDGAEVRSTSIARAPAGKDWAIVEIGGARDMLPRARLEGVGQEVSWTTIGHAAVRGRAGLHGVVRQVDACELDLYCVELDGKTWADARGISGSPCMIDGAAVALITGVATRPADAAIINGEVRALLLSDIVASTTRFTIDGTIRLPWEDVVTGALENLTESAQLTAAEHARLTSPAVGPRLPGQIARRMINQGFDTIVRVVRHVRSYLPSPSVREQILYAAGTLWIDSEAASKLATAIAHPAAVQLQTVSDKSACQHLGRAYTQTNRGPDGWRHVMVAYRDPFAEQIIELVREALFAFLRPVDDEDLDAMLADEPTIAFILATPDKRYVELLAARWPELRVVFLSRAVPVAANGIPAIEPAHAIDVEARAWSKYENALKAPPP